MLSIQRLIWDEWNVIHIARHNVIPDEVEDVCYGEPVVQQGKKGRLLVFGPTKTGRMISVVLDFEESKGVYYVVTARATSKRERAIYTKEKGGDNL